MTSTDASGWAAAGLSNAAGVMRAAPRTPNRTVAAGMVVMLSRPAAVDTGRCRLGCRRRARLPQGGGLQCTVDAGPDHLGAGRGPRRITDAQGADDAAGHAPRGGDKDGSLETGGQGVRGEIRLAGDPT